MSSLLQSSPAQNWLSSQGSSSGLIVKRTIRVDVPVDNYPNVWIIITFYLFIYLFPFHFFFFLFLTYFANGTELNFVCSITLLAASLDLGETLSSEWRQVLIVEFWLEGVVALRIQLG